jgi:hypothetical protein
VRRQLRENKNSGMADADTTSLSAKSNLSVKIYHMWPNNANIHGKIILIGCGWFAIKLLANSSFHVISTQLCKIKL